MPAKGLQGVFFGIDAATLQTLKTNYLNCLTAIATAGQSYSISGRVFTRADIEQVSNTIREIQQALDRASGRRVTQLYPLAGSSYPNTASGSSAATYPQS